MSKALLLKRPSPFAYPGGNPGFDPSHVASNGSYASFVKGGGGTLFNLLSPRPPSTNTIAAQSILSGLGPCINNTANFKEETFTGFPTAQQAFYTKAAIVQFTAVSSLQCIFGDGASSGSSFTGGTGLQLSAAGVVQIFHTGNTQFNAMTLLANVPYFLAFSYSKSTASNACSVVAVRLDTGQIVASTFSTNTNVGTAPSGTITIGSAAQVDKFYMAACMASSAFMTLPQLLQWVQDPWSFWYP